MNQKAMLWCAASLLTACGGDDGHASPSGPQDASSHGDAALANNPNADAGAQDVMDASPSAASDASTDAAQSADAAAEPLGTIQLRNDAFDNFGSPMLPTPPVIGGHQTANTHDEPGWPEKSEVSFETRTPAGVTPAFDVFFRYVALQYETLPTGTTTDMSPGDVAVSLDIKRSQDGDFTGLSVGEWACCTQTLCGAQSGKYTIDVTSVDTFPVAADAGVDHGFRAHGTLHAECPQVYITSSTPIGNVIVDMTF